MKRKLTTLLLMLCLLMGLVPLSSAEIQGQMAVRAFKAGKADAFLIRTKDHSVLIDTAEEDDSKKILNYLERMRISKLDLLIITHFDKGHIGGAPALLDALQVDKVLMPDYERGGHWHEQLMAALSKSGAPVERLAAPVTLSLGELTLEILADDSLREDDDLCLVTRVSHGSQQLLFCADIGDARLKRLLKAPEALKASLIQVPHHGRFMAQSEALLMASGAGQAIITCSDKNPPDEKLLHLLKAHRITYFLTMDGPIDIISDGHRLWFDQ